MACPVGRSQQAILRDGSGTMRPPTDLKDRPKRNIKPVIMLPQKQAFEYNSTFEFMEPSLEAYVISIITVSIGLGSIIFSINPGSAFSSEPLNERTQLGETAMMPKTV